MKVSIVLYDWGIQGHNFERVDDHQRLKSDTPRMCKYLLFARPDSFTVVVGPVFVWAVEYSHTALLKAYTQDISSVGRCLGGGTLMVEKDMEGTNRAHLFFWNKCLLGQYSDELASYADELELAFGCPVDVTKEP